MAGPDKAVAMGTSSALLRRGNAESCKRGAAAAAPGSPGTGGAGGGVTIASQGQMSNLLLFWTFGSEEECFD